jgi:hypothetical protein
MTDPSGQSSDLSPQITAPQPQSWHSAPLVRTSGFVVLALAAAAAMIFLRPSSVDAGGLYRAEIGNTLREAEEGGVEDVDRALLVVSARQQNQLLAAASSQQTAHTRLAVLVLLTMLSVCWHGLTLPRGG